MVNRHGVQAWGVVKYAARTISTHFINVDATAL